MDSGSNVQDEDTEEEQLYDEQIPSIFADKPPGVCIAYFNGPWLPMSYAQRFVNYSHALQYPLQILEILERRKRIVEAILDLTKPKQELLFDNRESRLESLFDELLTLREKKRPLYRKWTQQVGSKERSLSTPQKPLDELLRNYVKEIVLQAPIHPQAHGGEAGWSTQKSLQQHLPLGTVLSFDLSNAFGNVHSQYVFDFFYRLFESVDEDTRVDLSGFLTHLTTTIYGDYIIPSLPQGSPLSMSLFNRIFYPVDELFYKSACKRNLRYTRWVDDLIISAAESNRRPTKILGAVSIVREDFPLAPNKLFFQQDLPYYYLLGHKILGNMIIKVDKEEAKQRGEPLDVRLIRNRRENMWIDDYGEFEDEQEQDSFFDAEVPF